MKKAALTGRLLFLRAFCAYFSRKSAVSHLHFNDTIAPRGSGGFRFVYATRGSTPRSRGGATAV